MKILIKQIAERCLSRRSFYNFLGKTCAILITLFITATSLAAEEPIILRTTVVTQGDIWRGQRIVINLDLLGSDGWANIKTMREPEIPGMYILKTETQGTRLNETIGGISYTGQRYEFSVFPQASGKLIIPPIPIDVEIKNWGSNAKENISRKQTEPLTIVVKEPPGAEKIRDLVSTSSLTIKQLWEPEPKTLKVGDAFKRIITISAPDVSGMVFPPLTWEKPTILDIYPAAPEINDKIENNQVLGSRIETATYISQHEGTVTLPAISITWWNVDTKKLVKEELPALTLNIKANNKITTNRKAFGNTSNNRQAIWITTIALIITMAILIWIIVHYKIALQKKIATALEHRKESERAYFKRFVASGKTSDNRTTYNNLQAWLNCAEKIWSGQKHKPLNQQANLLWRAIETDKEFDKTPLLKSAKQARSKWKKHNQAVHKADNTLPPLNPTEQ